jgi:hypothetical protein
MIGLMIKPNGDFSWKQKNLVINLVMKKKRI